MCEYGRTRAQEDRVARVLAVGQAHGLPQDTQAERDIAAWRTMRGLGRDDGMEHGVHWRALGEQEQGLER